MRTRRPTGTLRNLLRNVGLALRVVPRMRPAVVVTTGAGVAVPFAWVGRLFGARVVYVESLTRIERPSLTYRLIRPIVSRTYVQWPELSRCRARSTAAPSSTGRDLRHARDAGLPLRPPAARAGRGRGGARRAGRCLDLPPGGRDVVRLLEYAPLLEQIRLARDRRLARRHRLRDDGRRARESGRSSSRACTGTARPWTITSFRSPALGGSRAGDARRRSRSAP